MSSWNWVTSKIALGPAPSEGEVQAMRTQGITDVLDLRGEPRQGETGPQPEMYVGSGIDYHYVGMLDRGGVEPPEKYREGIAVIANALAKPGKALVHCSAGLYRSPSMVYAYLRSIGQSPDAAWATIRAARPSVNRQYVQYAEAAVAGTAPRSNTGGTTTTTTGKTVTGGIGTPTNKNTFPWVPLAAAGVGAFVLYKLYGGR